MLTKEQKAEIENVYGYHAPKTAEHKLQIAQSRQLFAKMAEELTLLLPEGDAKANALACLQYASFNANAAIARSWGPAEPFGA